MEIELEEGPTPPSLNGFHSPAIRIPGERKSGSSNYTSLKDIIHSSSSPSASSPPATASLAAFPPTPTRSWDEIPIRNPLVKHAAMAYLQPMSTPTASFRGRGFAGRQIDRCFACLGCDGGEDVGCVAWLYDAVFGGCGEALGGFCGERRVSDEESDEDDEEDDKVD